MLRARARVCVCVCVCVCACACVCVRACVWAWQAAKIPASPLSPVMHREMLNHNHLYVDGNKITTTLGFTYKHTKVRIVTCSSTTTRTRATCNSCDVRVTADA